MTQNALFVSEKFLNSLKTNRKATFGIFKFIFWLLNMFFFYCFGDFHPTKCFKRESKSKQKHKSSTFSMFLQLSFSKAGAFERYSTIVVSLNSFNKNKTIGFCLLCDKHFYFQQINVRIQQKKRKKIVSQHF